VGVKSRKEIVVRKFDKVLVVPEKVSWCSDGVETTRDLFMTLHFFKKSGSWNIITVWNAGRKSTVRSSFVMSVVPKV
jgi:hypothetical protein